MKFSTSKEIQALILKFAPCLSYVRHICNDFENYIKSCRARYFKYEEWGKLMQIRKNTLIGITQNPDLKCVTPVWHWQYQDLSL